MHTPAQFLPGALEQLRQAIRERKPFGLEILCYQIAFAQNRLAEDVNTTFDWSSPQILPKDEKASVRGWALELEATRQILRAKCPEYSDVQFDAAWLAMLAEFPCCLCEPSELTGDALDELRALLKAQP